MQYMQTGRPYDVHGQIIIWSGSNFYDASRGISGTIRFGNTFSMSYYDAGDYDAGCQDDLKQHVEQARLEKSLLWSTNGGGPHFGLAVDAVGNQYYLKSGFSLDELSKLVKVVRHYTLVSS